MNIINPHESLFWYHLHHDSVYQINKNITETTGDENYKVVLKND